MQLKERLNNPLLANIASMGLVQVANYAIPILIIPYVVRALGVDAFGAASYAQNIAAYLTLLVTYGFDYSATQEIAIHKEDAEKVRQIFWRVISAKLLLFAATLAVLCALYLLLPRAKADPASFFYAGLINLGFALFPAWYFQGTERMAKMALFNFGVKSVGALLTIALVRNPGDYRLYVLSLSAAQVVVGFASLLYVAKAYHVAYTPAKDLLHSAEVTKGLPIFMNTFFVSCNLYAGVTIMGFYMTDEHIGIYTGAQRIVMAIMMIASHPITLSVFPRISRKFKQSEAEGLAYLKKCAACIAVFSLCVSLATLVAAPLAVKVLLGSEFAASTTLLRQMAFLPLLVSLCSTMTVQGLYGMQLQKYAPLIGIGICATSISANLCLVPRMGEEGVVLAWYACEVLELALATGIILMNKGKKARKD